MLKKFRKKRATLSMTLLVVTTSCEGLWGKEEEKDVKRGYLVARPLDLLAKVVGLKHFKRLNSALYSIYIYIYIYIDCTSARFYVAY